MSPDFWILRVGWPVPRILADPATRDARVYSSPIATALRTHAEWHEYAVAPSPLPPSPILRAFLCDLLAELFPAKRIGHIGCR